MPEIEEIWAAAGRAKALGDATRLTVALAFRRRPGARYVGDIAVEIDRHQSLVSRHCARLHEAGLLARRMDYMPKRPMYVLTAYGEALLDLVLEGPEGHDRSSRSARALA